MNKTLIANSPVVVLALLISSFLPGCSSSSGINSETATISPSSANVLTGQNIHFTTDISENANHLVWSVNGTVNGSETVGTIDATGNYIAPSVQPSAVVVVSVSRNNRPSVMASATVTVVGTGQVTPTAQPQVALYTIAPPVAATIAIQFGTDTSYGLTTWSQPAVGNAAPLAVFVAGMKANTLYHMRAVLQMPVTSPSFCTSPNERVYITARACELEFGGMGGMQAAGAGGL